MGLYNFKPRFVDKILAGEKTHTIRAPRVRQDKPGDVMHLYTGLRQKGAKLLGRKRCVKVETISITCSHDVWIDGQRLTFDECVQLALRDGFDSFADMMRFWDGRLPFRGHIFHWAAELPHGRVRSRNAAGAENLSPGLGLQESGPIPSTATKRARSKKRERREA